jgi:hypothetical protein
MPIILRENCAYTWSVYGWFDMGLGNSFNLIAAGKAGPAISMGWDKVTLIAHCGACLYGKNLAMRQK